MVGGVTDPAVYDALVLLGVSPLVLTGMDSALLYRAALATAERAQAAHRATKPHPASL